MDFHARLRKVIRSGVLALELHFQSVLRDSAELLPYTHLFSSAVAASAVSFSLPFSLHIVCILRHLMSILHFLTHLSNLFECFCKNPSDLMALLSLLARRTFKTAVTETWKTVIADNFSTQGHLSPHLTKINGNVNSHFSLNSSSPLSLVFCRQMLDILLFIWTVWEGSITKDIVEPFIFFIIILF